MGNWCQNPELPHFFFLLDVFVGFFAAALSFWPHNSPLALPIGFRVTRYSSLYCQSLEIFKLSSHSLKWKAARCVSMMEILQQRSPPIQAKDTHNPIKNISVLKYCENSGFSIRRAGVTFSRKATTDLLDRTKSEYSVFSV